MTTVQPPPLSLTLETRDHAVVVRVRGDLDYAGHDEFLHTVTTLLARRHAARHPVRELRLDFSALDGVDSSGLSALLRIRRSADEAGIALHLDERPPALERLLEVTGTLELLTAPPVPPAAGRRPVGS